MADTHQIPIITKKARTEGTNIETIVNRLNAGRIIIPNYQRDADQWDERKKSLFIESILNNLTIPGFFFSEIEDGKTEVVDGQQRLETIKSFKNDEFKLSISDNINYLVPNCTEYAGKRYSELRNVLKNIFDDYSLSIIFIPSDLDLDIKLEIFRRINEGGTPLTAHDIRLSYFNSRSVYAIRLAGIYSDSTASSKRMIEEGLRQNIRNYWEDFPDHKEEWYRWWEGKALAKGQRPSEMFLWYLVQLLRSNINILLDNYTHLNIKYRGKTEEVLDIFCAHLRYLDHNGAQTSIPTIGNGLEEYIKKFIEKIYMVLTRMPGISVDKYKQTALLIASMVELNVNNEDINDNQWDSLSQFIRTPRTAGSRWLRASNDGEGYPEPKGRWSGNKGQFAQCEAVTRILTAILSSND